MRCALTTLEDCLWNPRGAGGKRDDGAAVDMLLPRFPPSLSLSLSLSLYLSIYLILSLLFSPRKGGCGSGLCPAVGSVCGNGTERNGEDRPAGCGRGSNAGWPREEVRYMHRSSYLCIILATPRVVCIPGPTGAPVAT